MVDAGQYDLGRLERMVLRNIGDDFFTLNNEPEDPNDP